MRVEISTSQWNYIMEQLNFEEYKITDGENAIIYFTDPELRSILVSIDNDFSSAVVYCMPENHFKKIKSYFEEGII